jgi:hypothetical protein
VQLKAASKQLDKLKKDINKSGEPRLCHWCCQRDLLVNVAYLFNVLLPA